MQIKILASASIRRGVACATLLACFLAALAAPEARTQDPGLPPYYWPHRTVGIPVDVDHHLDILVAWGSPQNTASPRTARGSLSGGTARAVGRVARRARPLNEQATSVQSP